MARVEITETVSQALSALPVDGHSIPLTGLLLAPGDGASVEVRTRGAADTSGVTLYVAETGGSTRANPLTAGVEGRIEAWVNPGSYDLHVSLNGETYTHYFEAVRGDDPGGGGMADSVVLTPATSARNVVQPSAANAVALTLKGAAAQTADAQRWEDDAGAFSFVDKGGRLVLNADQDAPLLRGTLTLMNRTPDDPPAAKRPGLNFVHKAADLTETWDWHLGEDVASDPPDFALYHRDSGSDFLYITNETPEPRMGVNTGTWDSPAPGTLSVVSRVDDRPAFTAVTADSDQTGWIMKWGWGTGEWLGGIHSETKGLALGQASAALALIHLDTGTTAARGIRFGDDTVPLALYRSSESTLTLEGNQDIVSDGAALKNPLTLRNAAMTAAGQGVSLRFELGRITAPELTGWIDMLAEQTWTADAATHDAAMTFATGLDAVAAERMRLTATGRLGVGNPSPKALLHVGAGLDSPTASSTAYISHTGTTVLTVRDSTNDAELNIQASSAGGQIGTQTAHALSFKTSDLERMQILDDGALQLPEMTAPSAAGVNKGRLFMRDNGSGKTQFCAIFPTGAVQVIATEP